MNIDIQRYIQAMPQYQETLSFLQIILDFQVNLVEKIPSKVQIEPAIALKKWQTGQPLFAGESLFRGYYQRRVRSQPVAGGAE